MTLDPDICYRAVASRDARFDGRFFTGVLTTGVYCRPVCPARTPKAANVRFFACAAAAEEAGFRPCLRCRPETSPGTPAWVGTSATVSRALRLIGEGALDEGSIDDLAARLGMTARHLRRLFEEHLGASPVVVAQARRVHFAKTLVDDTDLAVTEIAFASGFSSVRRFNTVFKRTFDRSPTELRRGRQAALRSGEPISMRLSYRPPFDWSRMIAFLRDRTVAGVERVAGDVYRRYVGFGDEGGVIEVRPLSGRNALVLTVPAQLVPHLHAISDRARRLFDLKADPNAIADHLARDRMLRPVVRRYAGTRIPGAWNPFETGVRAILGQQVSVKGATTLCARLVERYGEGTHEADDATGAPWRAFPTPERLRRARMNGIGLTTARIRAIRAFAAAVADGTVRLDAAGDLDESVAVLKSLPGFGPWTAHYMSMRVLGEPDAFPSGDLALVKALRALDRSLNTEKKIVARAEAWRPWRAYATMMLWSWIAAKSGNA